MGENVTCGRKEGQEICSSRLAQSARTSQPLMFTSNGSTTNRTKKKTVVFHVQTDLSNSSSNLLDLHAAKCPPGETLIKMKKKKRIPFFVEANGKYVWSVSGDFKYLHHEVHRTTLYIPEETNLHHIV